MGSLVLYEAKNERKRAKNRIGPTMVYKYKMGLIEKKRKMKKGEIISHNKIRIQLQDLIFFVLLKQHFFLFV